MINLDNENCGQLISQMSNSSFNSNHEYSLTTTPRSKMLPLITKLSFPNDRDVGQPEYSNHKIRKYNSDQIAYSTSDNSYKSRQILTENIMNKI